jgi:TPR repeat protein
MRAMNFELSGQEPADAADCFALGIICASGQGERAVDMIEAHKWFNIAAARGYSGAVRMRREIAEQMSDSEIGLAQRAARDWLTSHPVCQPAPAPVIAIAA